MIAQGKMNSLNGENMISPAAWEAFMNHSKDKASSLDSGVLGSSVAIRDLDAFPVLLHRMLGEMQVEGNDHAVSWNPDGKSFTIHEPKVFADSIMPRYFRNQTRYKSFQRQLNLYRFKRFPRGKTKGVYFHTCFIREEPDLCRFVRRTPKQNNRSNRSPIARSPAPPVFSGRGRQQHQPLLASKSTVRQSVLPQQFGLTTSATTTSGEHFSGLSFQQVDKPQNFHHQCSTAATGGVAPISSGRSPRRASPSRQEPKPTFCGEHSLSYHDPQHSTNLLDLRTLFQPRSVEPEPSRTIPRMNNEPQQECEDDDDQSIGSIDNLDDIVMTSEQPMSFDSWAYRPVTSEIFP